VTTISSPVTIISGNLTVSGTTTTIDTETINLADNIVVLNSNYNGSTPSENAGIEVERGTLDNVSIRWNETSDSWQVTSNGTNYYDILTTNDLGAAGSIDLQAVTDVGAITDNTITLTDAANLVIEDATATAVKMFEVLGATGNTFVKGTLQADGAVDFNSSLTVDGATVSLDASANSNFTLTGNSSSSVNLTLSATNSGSSTGNVLVSADDEIRFTAATINYTGSAAFANTVYVGSTATFAGVTSYAGSATFNGNVDINSSATVDGATISLDATGNASNFTVTSSTTGTIDTTLTLKAENTGASGAASASVDIVAVNNAGSTGTASINLTATDEVDITATTIDINGTADISGALTVGSSKISIAPSNASSIVFNNDAATNKTTLSTAGYTGSQAATVTLPNINGTVGVMAATISDKGVVYANGTSGQLEEATSSSTNPSAPIPRNRSATRVLSQNAGIDKTGLQATLNSGSTQVDLTTGNTYGLIVNQTLTKTAGTGVFGASVYITEIESDTRFNVSVNNATGGSITFTANGLQGQTPSFVYPMSAVSFEPIGDSADISSGTIASDNGATLSVTDITNFTFVVFKFCTDPGDRICNFKIVPQQLWGQNEWVNIQISRDIYDPNFPNDPNASIHIKRGSTSSGSTTLTISATNHDSLSVYGIR